MPEIAWPADAPAASRWRRFFGHLLELLLIGLLFIVGWLIWLWFSAKKSQSPAKQLLGMYILTTDGQPASPLRVWIREPLLQWILIFNLPFALIIDFLFFMLDDNAQSLHDKIVETVVVRPVAPGSVSSAGRPPIGEARIVDAGHDAPRPTPPRAQPSTSADSREQRLRELEDLADKGLITVREYRDRRRQILEEMDQG